MTFFFFTGDVMTCRNFYHHDFDFYEMTQKELLVLFLLETFFGESAVAGGGFDLVPRPRTCKQ